MKIRKISKQYAPWFLLLMGVDIFSAFLLWIADAEAFIALSAVIVLASILLFYAVCLVLCRQEEKRKQVFLDFLDHPDERHERLLQKTLNQAYADCVHLMAQTLREKNAAYNQAQIQLSDYEEYVEIWAHETKAPLSLLTLLIDNRRDELPETVVYKLDSIRSHMQEFTSQMLYYSRLKSSRKDYLFEQIEISSCIEEVLDDYMPLLEEKQFQIRQAAFGTVYTDRRGLLFLLSQAVSNTVKYSGREPSIFFAFEQTDTAHVLRIRDHGTGVRSCDLPYIFEKGFTGDSGEARRQATGMGLYLAKEMADDLGLTLNAASDWGCGFELDISFPVM